MGAFPELSAGLVAGLCSVTFRDRSIAEVVDLASGVGLRAIEWGGDVHVPAGDLDSAQRARSATEDGGLRVVSYGSYLFCSPDVVAAAGTVAAVFDTAEVLGTSLVRVWCPFGVEPGASADDRGEVAAAVRAVAAAAAERDLRLYLEFHGGTLTATAASAVALLDEIDAPNVGCAWQPPYWAPQEVDLDVVDLGTLGSRLAHLHVYEWGPDGTRHPLSEGEAAWPRRLAAIDGPTPGLERAALLEFVRDDDPAQLASDAAALLGWLAALAPAAGPA